MSHINPGEIHQHRQSDHPLDDIFLNRWSPRSFAQKAIPEDQLLSIFEAARWAPSGSNLQPWRFIIARTEEHKKQFYSFINEGNLEWCQQAPVLALSFSYKQTAKGLLNGSHAFDAGAAWGYLALQATMNGMITHAMGGFNKEKAREVLAIPEDYELHAVIAIGYRGDKNQLSAIQQEREKPSVRNPTDQFIYEGIYGV